MNDTPSSSRLDLAVDIGNSGLRVARLDLAQSSVGQPMRINWLHPSSDTATSSPLSATNHKRDTRERFLPDSDQWFACLNTWLDGSLASQQSCSWHVSSVRADACRRLSQFVSRRSGDVFSPIHYSHVPLAVGVDEPQRLGIDRLLAALAASREVQTRPLLVIQAGSAVTVDIVELQGGLDCFAGGAILPGIPMMLRLLGRGADMLPELDAEDLSRLPELPGKNTEQAMLCGTASCLVGGVQHLVNRFRELHGSHTPVVVSGGDGVRLLPNIPPPVHVLPDLVLRGILQVARFSFADP